MNPALYDDGEVQRIAHELSLKYGFEAMSLAQSRAERAQQIGDEIALAIWEKVLAAMSPLSALQR
ncbi:MAG TPA: hypothetical protein VN668_22820 [Stellaceae bacterium]|nr:hypothetical protein [Stellaceae bacterium]HXS40966.1 hypothetical protein [Stellaceae bacterium]